MAEINNKFPLDISGLEERIGYTFSEKKLLKTALRHSSFSNEQCIYTQSNERLEFLGDSVISIITSEFLYGRFPTRPEGQLSNFRREIVDGDSLANFAREIHLGDYMSFGHGEEKNGGRDRKTNLEDAFEALAGAMFLDGGLNKVKEFFIPFVKERMDQILKTGTVSDPKSQLQELVQSNGETVEYKVIGESGPDHDKRFLCAAMLGSNEIGRGEGRRIQEAEMNAARRALALFGEKGSL